MTDMNYPTAPLNSLGITVTFDRPRNLSEAEQLLVRQWRAARDAGN